MKMFTQTYEADQSRFNAIPLYMRVRESSRLAYGPKSHSLRGCTIYAKGAEA